MGAEAERKNMHICPSVLIERDTSARAVFKQNGNVKDASAKMFDVSLVGYDADCVYNTKKQQYGISVRPVFDIELGSAQKDRDVSFDYFVAMPQYYPAKDAKQLFSVNTKMPKNSDKIHYRDNDVYVGIPVEEGKKISDYEVYIGLQLDKDELEYNRKNNQ